MKLTKEYLIKQLGPFRYIQNMQNNNGTTVVNQFEIYFEYGKLFQSYNSIIAIKFHCDVKNNKLENKVILGKNYDYSTTTGKYRNIFLREKLKETRDKIDNGTYIYAEHLV